MVTGATDGAFSEGGLGMRPYAKSVGQILLRLFLQIVAGLIATGSVIALCFLPAVTSSHGFKLMAAEPFGMDRVPVSSAIEYFQLIAECLFFAFALIEFARALVRIARLGRP